MKSSTFTRQHFGHFNQFTPTRKASFRHLTHSGRGTSHSKSRSDLQSQKQAGAPMQSSASITITAFLPLLYLLVVLSTLLRVSGFLASGVHSSPVSGQTAHRQLAPPLPLRHGSSPSLLRSCQSDSSYRDVL